MQKFGPILAAVFIALASSGCTTTNNDSASLTTTSFASTTETSVAAATSVAPIPATKPDTEEAKASLAASVEVDAGGTVPAATTVAFAPASEQKVPAPLQNQAKSIPQEAVDVANAAPVVEAPVKSTSRERDCLMRAMYFESIRSSADGQLAVGTVVMHRIAHGAWGKSVCGVVGAKRQFAPGVMTRQMQGDTSDLARLADAILAGKRHPKLAKNVMFFHVAGMKFPYKNMRYVLVAGGNTFYYKASRRRG